MTTKRIAQLVCQAGKLTVAVNALADAPIDDGLIKPFLDFLKRKLQADYITGNGEGRYVPETEMAIHSKLFWLMLYHNF